MTTTMEIRDGGGHGRGPALRTSTGGQDPASAVLPPIPFGRLLKVEAAKILDTRSARWLVAVSLLVSLAAMGLPLGFPDDVDQTLGTYLGLASVGLTLLLPVVAILSVTSEWSQRTVLVTFTQEPRRARVLAAKLVNALILGVAAAAAGLAITAGSVWLAEAGLGREVVANRGWLEVGAGLLALSVLNMLMAMGFAVLLQSSAAAVALFYILPTIWTVLAVGVLKDVGDWLDTSRTFERLMEGGIADHLGQAVTSMTLWVAVPLVAGFLRTMRREIS